LLEVVMYTVQSSCECWWDCVFHW